MAKFNNIDLPKDIVKCIYKKIARCVLLFLLLAGVSVLIGVLSWQTLEVKTGAFFHVCILLLLAAVPFWASGFPRKLIDKSWTATVTEVCIKERTGTFTDGEGEVFPYSKNVICLKVRKDNGKEKYIAVKEFGIRRHKGFPVPNEGDVTHHLDDYSIGDKVYHFYGLEHYCVVKKNSEMAECVVCGASNPSERTDCLNCGHSLIKNI